MYTFIFVVAGEIPCEDKFTAGEPNKQTENDEQDEDKICK